MKHWVSRRLSRDYRMWHWEGKAQGRVGWGNTEGDYFSEEISMWLHWWGRANSEGGPEDSGQRRMREGGGYICGAGWRDKDDTQKTINSWMSHTQPPRLELSTFPPVGSSSIVLFLSTQHHHPSSYQSTILASPLTSPSSSLDAANQSPIFCLNNLKKQSALCPCCHCYIWGALIFPPGHSSQPDLGCPFSRPPRPPSAGAWVLLHEQNWTRSLLA